MTKFTKQFLLFKDISGKKIQADFEGGEGQFRCWTPFSS